jgi:single-strand DNA-binding protein
MWNNSFKFIGRLGQDAETRFTQSGISVANLNIATSTRFKNKQSGQWEEKTEWVRVTFFNSEKLSNFLTKGKLVYAEGRIQNSTYTNKEGQEVRGYDFIAETVQLLSKNEGGNQSAPADAPVASASDDSDGIPF